MVSILSAVLHSSYCKPLGNTQLKEQLLEKKPCLPNSDPEINRKKVNRKQLFALSPSWRFLSSWNSVDTCNKIFHIFWKIFRQGLVMTLWAFSPKNHLWEGFFGSTVWNTYFWVLGGGDLEPSYHSRGHIKRKKFYHENFKNKAIFSSLAVKIHKLEKNRPHHWNLLTKTLLNWIVLFCTPKKNFLETLQWCIGALLFKESTVATPFKGTLFKGISDLSTWFFGSQVFTAFNNLIFCNSI